MQLIHPLSKFIVENKNHRYLREKKIFRRFFFKQSFKWAVKINLSNSKCSYWLSKDIEMTDHTCQSSGFFHPFFHFSKLFFSPSLLHILIAPFSSGILFFLHYFFCLPLKKYQLENICIIYYIL